MIVFSGHLMGTIPILSYRRFLYTGVISYFRGKLDWTLVDIGNW